MLAASPSLCLPVVVLLFTVTVSNGRMVVGMQAAPDPGPMAALPVPQEALLPVVAPPVPEKHQWPTPTEASGTPWWRVEGGEGITLVDWYPILTAHSTLVPLPMTNPSTAPATTTPKPTTPGPSGGDMTNHTPKPAKPKKPAKPAKTKKPANAKTHSAWHQAGVIAKTMTKLAKAATKLFARR